MCFGWDKKLPKLLIGYMHPSAVIWGNKSFAHPKKGKIDLNWSPLQLLGPKNCCPQTGVSEITRFLTGRVKPTKFHEQ